MALGCGSRDYRVIECGQRKKLRRNYRRFDPRRFSVSTLVDGGDEDKLFVLVSPMFVNTLIGLASAVTELINFLINWKRLFQYAH